LAGFSGSFANAHYQRLQGAMTTSNLKQTNRPLSIRLPEPLIEEAKAKAEKLDVPYQRLMREVLQHGIRAIKI
jgi:predicted DNA binding CopG/RHH family protein